MSTFEPMKFSAIHDMRDADFSTIETVGLATDADSRLDFLVDERQQTFWKQSVPTTGGSIRYDRGAGVLTSLTHLIIPAGHNLTGELVIRTDTTAGFPGSIVRLRVNDISPDHQIFLEWDTATNDRFVQFRFNTLNNNELSQLLFTTQTTFVRGTELDNMVDELEANVQGFPQPSGAEPRLERGPKQRRMEVAYPILDSEDLAAMSVLIQSVGTEHPLWVEPPIYATSCLLDQDLTAATTGDVTVIDGGDMSFSTVLVSIGDELVLGKQVDPTTFNITFRGFQQLLGSPAYTHAPSERFVTVGAFGDPLHRIRWMKFVEMPDERVRGASLLFGLRKDIGFELIDHSD